MKDLRLTTVAKFTVMDQLDIPMAEQTRLYIEGYASVNRDSEGNKNIDRDQEVYDIPSLDIENYKKNGPILFTHNWEKVIGQAITIEKRFEGLYIKAEIHKVPGMEDVFYGVQNGLIRAFSISAIPKAFEYLEKEDAIELQDAELIEISLLAVPSNAQSLFTVTNSKGLSISAKEVASQNDMTLCELKGICGITKKSQKEKGLEMNKVITKEPEVTPEPVVVPEPVVEPVVAPVVEPEPVVEPVAPAAEPVPAMTEDTIAAALIKAQTLAENILAEKAEALVLAQQEEATQVAAAETARVDSANAYMKEQTETFINTPNGEIDTDSIEAFYELITGHAEQIEAKIGEAIKEQAGA